MKPTFVKTNQAETDRNFQELTRLFAGLFPLVSSNPVMSVALVAGDNTVTPNVPVPQGRFITYQDAASTLFDKGFSGGKWTINASAPCNIKLTFF